jgi:hypothetical protein
MKEKKEKDVRSIYMDIDTIKAIEKEAQKQRRNFSFIASEILNEWVKKQLKKI